jgi:hypothetical protein
MLNREQEDEECDATKMIVALKLVTKKYPSTPLRMTREKEKNRKNESKIQTEV